MMRMSGRRVSAMFTSCSRRWTQMLSPTASPRLSTSLLKASSADLIAGIDIDSIPRPEIRAREPRR